MSIKALPSKATGLPWHTCECLLDFMKGLAACNVPTELSIILEILI